MSHFLFEATTGEAAELAQDSLLKRHSNVAPLKLHWRSLCLKHFLHIVPGERILQLGSGSGLWTAELANVLGYQNEIVAAVFSEDLLRSAPQIPETQFISGDSLECLEPRQFDYVISSILSGESLNSKLLSLIHRLLKPGGQVFFFQPNVENPWRKCSAFIQRTLSLGRNHSRPVKMRSRSETLELCAAAGLTDALITPYDLLPWGLRRKTALRIQAKAILLEHAPILKEFSGSQCLAARKPGIRADRLNCNLAEHPTLFDSVSVVVPCYNEAPNIPKLVQELFAFYGNYIHEILLVNDNSTDNTVEIVNKLSRAEHRVKLINRAKPNGVGRALRDGYHAASGRYILSMDCDFVSILPELRGLFDVIAAGCDGAIGSRFSHDSVVLNYPFSKMVYNRFFHLLLRFAFKLGIRDVTNNVKLYRAEILKGLVIRSAHFSANLETGLKPLLEGFDVREVPISWIDRTADMGTSNFHPREVGGDYVRAFLDIWRTYRSGQRQDKPIRARSETERELGRVSEK
jgi:dolichol-phosphate mannosyltransferase